MTASPLDMPRKRHVEVVPPRIRLTPHAQMRAQEFGFTMADVLRAAEDPETRYETDPRKYKPGEFVCKRGNVSVVLREADRTVVTVLLPSPDRWEHRTGR